MSNCEICNQKTRFIDLSSIYGPNMCGSCMSKYEKLRYHLSDYDDIAEYDQAESAFIENAYDKQKAEALLKGNRERVLKVLNKEEYEAELARKEEEKKRLEAEKAREEKEKARNEMIDHLKSRGLDGYYEYTTISLVDKDGGYIDAGTITANLNELGLHGWRLVTGFSNEIGHNSSSAGLFGISAGTNATIDQNVLILERFVRI